MSKFVMVEREFLNDAFDTSKCPDQFDGDGFDNAPCNINTDGNMLCLDCRIKYGNGKVKELQTSAQFAGEMEEIIRRATVALNATPTPIYRGSVIAKEFYNILSKIAAAEAEEEGEQP